MKLLFTTLALCGATLANAILTDPYAALDTTPRPDNIPFYLSYDKSPTFLEYCESDLLQPASIHGAERALENLRKFLRESKNRTSGPPRYWVDSEPHRMAGHVSHDPKGEKVSTVVEVWAPRGCCTTVFLDMVVAFVEKALSKCRRWDCKTGWCPISSKAVASDESFEVRLWGAMDGVGESGKVTSAVDSNVTPGPITL